MAVLAQTTVKLIEATPDDYDVQSLRHFANLPPTNDERLAITSEALVYQTDYRVLDLFKRAFLAGASRWAPDSARQLIEHFLSYVDTDDRTLWMPWSEIRLQTAVCNVTFGARVIPFYSYGVSTHVGSVHFLQVPVGHRFAERDFQTMCAQLG